MTRTIPPHDADNAPERAGAAEVVSRLATVIRNTSLDCECRERLDQSLARFMALENRRTTRRSLLDARMQRDRIEAFLSFLKELDEINSGEPDHSVYKEIALLFDDIAHAAKQGADLMRRLSQASLSA